MLIINEVKEAEKIINTNKYDKLASAVNLLVRYYWQIKRLTKEEVKEKIRLFIELNHEEFEYWENSVKRMIKNADKFPLCQLNEIPITQKEIDIIFKAGTEKKEKILFTFLVLAKLKYLKSGKAWVNDTGSSTFKLANAQTGVEDRDYIIRDFYEAEFISYAKSPMNMSIHIDFIDTDGDTVFVVNDLRNLGYRWLKFKGHKYIECNECGKLFKPTKGNSLYCKDHRGYIPLRTKIIECCDCGISFETAAITKSKRCPLCQRLHYNERKRVNRLKCRVD